eukprot:CAMPEP_0194262780 /NCGR_PEP_ID=MMETSP0158-20130606/46717_1 /TAXON_ID=33649 /ORGANISM="Thalassionema nitzschioides, Strain L26-B" /LENGTH=361 /DNA_ID=CAMNT_0039002939 /DNA_START=1378 /DNA_END=2463 /DNA_ORIENTATION=-
MAQQPGMDVEEFGESARGLENEKSKETRAAILQYRHAYIKRVVKEYRLLKNKNGTWRRGGFSLYNREHERLIYDLSCQHTQYHREEAASIAESDAVAVGMPTTKSSSSSSSSPTELVSNPPFAPTKVVDNDISVSVLLNDGSEDLPALSKEKVNKKILSDLARVKETMRQLQEIIQDSSFDDTFCDLIRFLRSCVPRVKDLVDYTTVTDPDDSLLSEQVVMECLCMHDQLEKLLGDIDSCLGLNDDDAGREANNTPDEIITKQLEENTNSTDHPDEGDGASMAETERTQTFHETATNMVSSPTNDTSFDEVDGSSVTKTEIINIPRETITTIPPLSTPSNQLEENTDGGTGSDEDKRYYDM